MKKLLVFFLLVMSAGVCLYSQESYLELFRTDWKAEKVAIVTENMGLTDAQSQAFWPVYRKYDAELTTLNDQAIAIFKDYAENYEKMTDAKADALTKQLFSFLKKRVELQEKYYKEFAKALDPTLAARFMQVDRKINAIVDLQISAEIPLITK